MRWSEIAEGSAVVGKQRKQGSANVASAAKLRANIPVKNGAIIGIPIEDMEAWEDAQNNGIDTPEPEPRQIE